jgi:hypothetical protein
MFGYLYFFVHLNFSVAGFQKLALATSEIHDLNFGLSDTFVSLHNLN